MQEQIGKGGWILLYLVTGAIDAFQALITPTGIGALVNEVLDPIIGIILALYFWKKGLFSPAVAFAFIMEILLKEGTFGLAPTWFLVVGFVQVGSYKKLAVAKAKKMIKGGNKTQIKNGVESARENGTLNEGGSRKPPKLK